MRISTLIFILTILFSCGDTATNEPKDFRSQHGLPPKDTMDIPAAAPITGNPKPIDAAWNDFWKTFQQAVANDGRAMMFSLVEFPFLGANHLASQIYAERCSQDDFRLGYFEIFDDFVKRAVERTSAIEIESFAPYGDAFRGSKAQKVGLKEGSKIYKFKVGLATKTNAGTVAMGSDIFYFAKFGSRYKLAWVEAERPE